MPHSKPDARALAARLAAETQPEALAAGRAVLVGNRAGVVEWASEAWSTLTGFPLSETEGKPISHFLDHAGLEIELVEFVAQHFLAGRPCTLQSPFESFDGRRIQIHLEVQPHRDRTGEIARFVAVANAVGESADGARLASPVAPPQATDKETELRTDPPSLRPGTQEASAFPGAIAASLRRALDRLTPTERGEAFFDFVHDADTRPGWTDASSLDALTFEVLRIAFENADTRGTYVTALTGLLEAHGFHRSQAHPVTARVGASNAPRAYLEVHDTGPHLDRDALARIRGGAAAPQPREQALARLVESADQVGGTLHLDSTPGCGTQVLVEFEPMRTSD